MKEADLYFLNQLVSSLEEAGLTLEQAYPKKDYENFNKSKKLILLLQKKITEVTNGL